MIRSKMFLIALFMVVSAAAALADDNALKTGKSSGFAGEQATENASRRFSFRYAGSLLDVPVGAIVRVWVPLAQSNEQQVVTPPKIQLPSKAAQQIAEDEKYGNQILCFTYRHDSDSTFVIDYGVTRKEARSAKSQKELSDVQRKIFLAANRNVPLTGKPAALLMGKTFSKDPKRAGRELYELVDRHMKYDKSKPGYGRGDVLWACDSKTGNCTDFHSLFISLARQNKIPARFEIGFPLPPDKPTGKIQGYHCWAWFFAKDEGWIPVDISEADKHPEMRDYYFGNLTADRIAFTTGRDIELRPKPKNEEPLNYFVFPYVEVDGKTWPKEKIELNFSFADIEKAVRETP